MIEGDKSKAVCYKCKRIADTTFKYSEYKVSSKITIPKVLLGFCDECGDCVSIPHDSVSVIKHYLVKNDRKLRKQLVH